MNFTKVKAESKRKKTVKSEALGCYFAFIMDRSTDISGDEQEILHIWLPCKGQKESAAKEDLKTCLKNCIKKGIDKGLN